MSQDNAGFAEFFAASWDPCLRAVAASTGNMTLAEDQTAEAFARAWASWHMVSYLPAPRAWVVRTALNAGASWWHRRRKETALTSHDIAAADSALTREMRDRVSEPAAPERPPLAAIINRGLDHAALQQALAQHGIPALVKTDTYCSSNPAAPDPRSFGVLSVRPPVAPGMRRARM